MPKLNVDCARDILLTIQDLDFNSKVDCRKYQNYPRLKKYSEEEFTYHVVKLDKEEYIDAHIVRGDNLTIPLYLYDLSWNGHDFLKALGNDNVYQKTKNKVTAVAGTVSLEVLKLVAIETSKSLLGLK